MTIWLPSNDKSFQQKHGSVVVTWLAISISEHMIVKEMAQD